MNGIEKNLIGAPYRNLIAISKQLKDKILLRKAFGAQVFWTNFSWVYGLSEVQLKEFHMQYQNNMESIKNGIEFNSNEILKQKLHTEFKHLPPFNLPHFIVNADKTFWIFTAVRPFKRIRMTVKFNNLLEEILRTCERMINYIENPEWLELKLNDPLQSDSNVS